MFYKSLLKTVLIISLIFIFTLPAQAQTVCGDVDLTGEVNVADLVFMVNYLFKGGPELCPTPSGEYVGHTNCKGMKTADTLETNWDCLEYNYTGSNLLTLKHVNTAFNCCSLKDADIIIDDSLILIVESESFSDPYDSCYCECLFDLDFEISNLPPGIYTIKIDQLYLDPGHELMEFTIELTTTSITDSYCIYREHYPWGY
ncbi:MAG: hypothetical protein ABIJ12_10855 [bacterium]